MEQLHSSLEFRGKEHTQRERERERERERGYNPHHIKISMLNKKHTWIRKFEKDH
jgi:hypothetical protein